MNTWELDYIGENGHVYLEKLVCGTYEFAQEYAEKLSKETGRTYTIQEDSFPDYLRQDITKERK